MARIKATSAEVLKQYRNEVRRIHQFQRRAEKRGYLFEEDVIKKPKTVTEATVRRLKKLTAEELYKKATAVDLETGEVVQTEEKRKQERSKSAKKAARTRKERTRQRKESQDYEEYLERKRLERELDDYELDDYDYSTSPDYTQTDKPSYPTMDVISWLVDELEKIPDGKYIGRGKWLDMEERRNALVDILKDNAMSDETGAYIDYLESKQGEISEAIEVTMYDSDSGRIEMSFIRLANIINQGIALSQSQAEAVNNMQVLWDEY